MLNLAALFVPSANADVRCEDHLRLPGVEKADIGQRYTVQTINSSNPLVARLTAVTKREGSIIFDFDEGDKGTKYSLPLEQIFSAKPVPSWIPKLSWPTPDFSWDGVKKSVVGILDIAYLSLGQFHGLVKPQLPMFTHARSDRVRVGSLNPVTDGVFANRVVDQLTAYDAHFEALGFRIPDITKIVVQYNTLIPALSPGLFRYPLLTLRRGCFKHVIKLLPMNHDSRYVTDRFVLFHERAHSFLFATYRPDSLVNADLTIQEGLADFIAAHYLNSPRAEELAADELRDIENRANHGVVLKSILDLTGEAHNDGLFISNLLWKIRSQIGAAAMNELLPLITDGLNRYQVDSDLFPRTSKNANVWRLENIVSVLRHLAKSSSFKPGIDEAVDLYIAELSLDSGRLGKMAEAIVDYQDSDRATGPELSGVVFGLIGSSVGLAIDGMILHALTRLF